MTAASPKPPKREKPKPQTAEERLEAMRYNQMMYGPTAGERRLVAKSTDFGAAYLKHPKFLALMQAFKGGTRSEFNVTHKEKSHTISTDGEHLFFDGKVVYYARALNRFERNLLVDRSVLLQYQTLDPFIHLVFAVIRSMPEVGVKDLSHRNGEFLLAGLGLDSGIAESGPNLLLGAFKVPTGKAK